MPLLFQRPNGRKPYQFKFSIRRSGRSHLTVIRTHIRFLITSFPVLKQIYKINKLCVNNYFCSLSCGKTSRLALVSEPPADVRGVRVFDAEEVGQFAIIRSVVETKIGALARL